MKKYRQKPVEQEVVEAVQFVRGNYTEAALWCGGRLILDGRVVSYVRFRDGRTASCVGVRDIGREEALVGDWIVKRASGFFEALTPKGFTSSYEPND